LFTATKKSFWIRIGLAPWIQIRIETYADPQHRMFLPISSFCSSIIPPKPVLWIRIRWDPKLFAGSGLGSEKIIPHLGSPGLEPKLPSKSDPDQPKKIISGPQLMTKTLLSHAATRR
jgi:hypothetical protein